MKVSIDAIKQLREKTGASLGDVRKALEQSGGDEAKAQAWLRERGVQIAAKRGDRKASEGRVASYIHHDGRVGAIVEVCCETDFVARTEEFGQFCREVAMHITAMQPACIKPEDVPADTGLGPDAALLEQPFIKDQGTKVGDLLKELIAKTGENVSIRRFQRFSVGGE